jgi:hypothetical protein
MALRLRVFTNARLTRRKPTTIRDRPDLHGEYDSIQALLPVTREQFLNGAYHVAPAETKSVSYPRLNRPLSPTMNSGIQAA